jgi:7-cyano-7-deazaguanine synthase
MMPDCIAIVSGGIDSVTLLHYLVKEEKRNPAVITSKYGQKHDKEVSFAQAQAALLGCEEQIVLDLGPMSAVFAGSALIAGGERIPEVSEVLGDPQPATYVPNRNMIFLALAAAFAESQGVGDIFYGAQRHDMYGYWDTTPEFLERVNSVFGLNRKTPIKILAPFVTWPKTEILQKGLEMGVGLRPNLVVL